METNDVEPNIVKAVMSFLSEVGKLLHLTKWQMTRVESHNAGVLCLVAMFCSNQTTQGLQFQTKSVLNLLVTCFCISLSAMY